MGSVRGPQFPLPVPGRGVNVAQLQKDIGPDFLAAAENFVLRDGVMQLRENAAGLTGFDNFSFRIQGLAEYVAADESRFVAWADTDGVKVSDGTTTYDLDGSLSGDDEDLAVMRTFTKGSDNFLLHVNGVDALKFWTGDTSDDMADASGSPPVARTMMVLANRLLLCGIPALNGSAVDPSAEFDFESGYSTNRVILGDTPGPIVAALERGNFQGTIFKDDSLWMAEFTGAADPFSYRLVQIVPGPVSPLAVCNLNYGGLQFYVGNDGNGYLFDGLQAQTIGRRFQKYLRSTWNLGATNRITCFYDPDQSEVHVLYAEAASGDNNLDLIVKMPTGDIYPQRVRSKLANAAGFLANPYYWTVGMKARVPSIVPIGDVPSSIGESTLTIGDFSTVAPQVIVGAWVPAADGGPGAQVLVVDVDSIDAAFFETALMQGDKDWTQYLLNMIEHFLTSTADDTQYTVQIGTSTYGYDRAFDATVVEGTIGTGPNTTGHRVTSRFFSMRVDVLQNDASDRRAVSWRGSMATVAPAGGR